jgi:predicted transcriptional regulator
MELNAGRQRQLSYKTILTILTRLEAKGWLSHERDGRAYRYSATVNERTLTELQARRAAEALLDKFGDLALSGFVDEVASDRERLARLEDLLVHRRAEAVGR